MTSDPVDELLRGFRADAPEPDDAQRARACARATRTRRRRLPVALAFAVVAAAAVALALVVPGHRQASAATILQRVVAATATPQKGILHLRYETVGVPFAGAGKSLRVTVESWRELGGEHRLREVGDAIAPPATVEIFGGNGSMQLYDPRANALYDLAGHDVLPLGPSSSVGALADATSMVRDQLRSGAVAGVWQVTRMRLDGRDVYRIARRQIDVFDQVRALYVDAQSYVPVRLDETGPPRDQPGGPYARPRNGFALGKRYPPSVTVTTISTYETLPDGGAELDPAQVHPDARRLPVSELRPDVAAQIVASSGATWQVPAPPTVGQAHVVDPLAGSVGSFRVGESLLALSKVVTPGGLTNVPVWPGDLRDAAIYGASDGSLIVTFGDANEQHSTSATVGGPFRTTRGDVNGRTTRDELLARWPEHGATTDSTVVVGRATFSFDAGGLLRSVALR